MADEPQTDDAEEELAEGTLVSHLIELRQRIFKALLAVILIFIGLFPFSQQIFNFVKQPLEQALALDAHANAVAPLGQWTQLWQQQLDALRWLAGSAVRESSVRTIEQAFDRVAALSAVLGAVNGTRALQELRGALEQRMQWVPSQINKHTDRQRGEQRDQDRPELQREAEGDGLGIRRHRAGHPGNQVLGEEWENAQGDAGQRECEQHKDLRAEQRRDHRERTRGDQADARGEAVVP